MYIILIIIHLSVCYILTGFAKERGISEVGIFFLSLICTPITGMFMILATPTLKQRELEALMLNYYRNKSNDDENS